MTVMKNFLKRSMKCGYDLDYITKYVYCLKKLAIAITS